MSLPTQVHPSVAEAYSPDLIRSPEVCRRAGITYRQLDYRVRMGHITPVVDADGPGTTRLFDPAVVDEIRAYERGIDNCPFPHRRAK